METQTRLDEEEVGDGLGEGDFDGVGVGLLLLLLGLLLGLELLDELLVGLGLLLALGLLLGLLLALGLLLLVVGLLLPEGLAEDDELVRAVGAGLVPEAPSGTALSPSVRNFIARWPCWAAVTVTGGLGCVLITAAAVLAEQARALATEVADGLVGPVTIMPSKPEDPSARPAARLNMEVELSIGLMDASSPPRSIIPVVGGRHTWPFTRGKHSPLPEFNTSGVVRSRSTQCCRRRQDMRVSATGGFWASRRVPEGAGSAGTYRVSGAGCSIDSDRSGLACMLASRGCTGLWETNRRAESRACPREREAQASTLAPLAQSAERLHGKEKVYGSIP